MASTRTTPTRFAVDSAKREYETANGAMKVWWTRVEDGLGQTELEIPGVGDLSVEAPFGI